MAENGDVVYTPNANFSGTDSFSYYFIVDGTVVATPTVTVTVLPVNDAPVAVADNIGNIVYSGFTTVAPLGNDTDVESPAADLKVSTVSGAVNCEVKIAADRKRVYVKPLAAGPFSFEYAAADPSGAKSAPVTVSGTYVQ
ncbi:hypothetical protein EON81_08220 [bacterium]|nr:MAG: hypothetical protein EON81_08220 [bacterium]